MVKDESRWLASYAVLGQEECARPEIGAAGYKHRLARTDLARVGCCCAAAAAVVWVLLLFSLPPVHVLGARRLLVLVLVLMGLLVMALTGSPCYNYGREPDARSMYILIFMYPYTT